MTPAGRLPVAIRALHWGVATVVVLNALVLEHGSLLHRGAGLLGVGLVVARQFWKRPVPQISTAAAYVHRAIWVAIAALGVSGWTMGTDAFWGDSRVDAAHRYTVYVLALLVAAHLAGVALDALRHKRMTWMRMIDGR